MRKGNPKGLIANHTGELDRRQILISAIALAAGCILHSPRALAAGGGATTSRAIDVHHHFFPPVFQEASAKFLKAAFGEIPAAIKNWSPSVDIESMDRNNIGMAVINTSARPPEPGAVTIDAYRAQARAANDYAAKMVQDHPTRFAQFGFLPMPDIDGSLREIEYALDQLKAPGIGMMTSYGSRWQGNPAFAPVLEELNRRKAVVFCHPLPAACCRALMPDVISKEPLLLEFPYDTGRAVVSLLIGGSFSTYHDIRWIFCHCGDVVPALSGRIRNLIADMPADEVAKFAPRGMDYELRRQYYDTADAAYGPSMAAIQSYIPASQIMFGTDYPYVSMESNLKELRERRLSSALMRGIERDNVLRLMPQLSSLRQ
ncbi:MAG TPA: amidohydrolase family protein [Steroidobacteraceae bacterium]